MKWRHISRDILIDCPACGDWKLRARTTWKLWYTNSEHVWLDDVVTHNVKCSKCGFSGETTGENPIRYWVEDLLKQIEGEQY